MNSIPRQPKDIAYRYNQLSPRWRARTELWTDDHWETWRSRQLARLITKHKVLAQREIEARLSDFVIAHHPRIEPHHLARLKRELDLVAISSEPVPLYTRRKMRKLDYAAPLASKTALHTDYSDLARYETCGSIGERVVYESLFEAARQNSALVVRPHEPGHVTNIDGRQSPFSFDTYGYLVTSTASTTLSRDATPFGVEVKNIREWIYPDSAEIWQTVRAAADLRCIPVLVARRIHFSSFKLFRDIGMVGFEAQRQYFALSLAEDERFESIFDGLYYRDMLPWETAEQFIVRFFANTMPSQVARAIPRFPVVRDLLWQYATAAEMANDGLDPSVRSTRFSGFREEFKTLGQAELTDW